MKLHNKIIIATVVLLGLILGSCLKEPPPQLRIGIPVWPGFECLYLARDLGYYKNTSIRLVDYRANSEMLRAFRNGELEAAALTILEAFSLVTAASNLQFVLATEISNGGDAIVAKPEVHDDEVELLQSVGNQLAIANDQAELYEQTRVAAATATAQTEQLRQTLQELQQTQALLRRLSKPWRLSWIS